MEISFNRLARMELDEASHYYDEQVPGLGSRFLDEVEQALLFIQLHPEAAPRVDKSRRRFVLSQFPYYILYRVFPGEHLRILAVGHQNRHPRYWRGRA